MLPPTQQRPAESQMSEAALRARQSPALSLFNRLDALTHQLFGTRDFFAEWPQQMCHRIRTRAGPAHPHQHHHQHGYSGQELTSMNHQVVRGYTNQRTGNSSSGECWNGRDLSGYNKPLAPFGFPLSAGHPEVPAAQAQAVSPLVLNLVARLREVGTQLALKSTRPPYSPMDFVGTNGPPRGKSQVRLAADSPLAEARVSSTSQQQLQAAALSLVATGEANDEQQQQQQQQAALSLIASAASVGGMEGTVASQSDDSEAPDVEAAESEGDSVLEDELEPEMAVDQQSGSNNGGGGGAEEDEVDDEPHPDCATHDCSDLLLGSTTSGSSSSAASDPLGYQTSGAGELHQATGDQQQHLNNQIGESAQGYEQGRYPAPNNGEPAEVLVQPAFTTAHYGGESAQQPANNFNSVEGFIVPPGYVGQRAHTPATFATAGQLQLSLQVFLVVGSLVLLLALLVHTYRTIRMRALV